MYWHDGMGFAGWWAMGLGMLLFWGVVIGGVALLVRWAVGNRGPRHEDGPGGGGHGPVEDRGARRLLDERFARGEIDVEEYRHRREVLRGG